MLLVGIRWKLYAIIVSNTYTVKSDEFFLKLSDEALQWTCGDLIFMKCDTELFMFRTDHGPAIRAKQFCKFMVPISIATIDKTNSIYVYLLVLYHLVAGREKKKHRRLACIVLVQESSLP